MSYTIKEIDIQHIFQMSFLSSLNYRRAMPLKGCEVDDDLTDLSWLVGLNGSQQKSSSSSNVNKCKKSDQLVKPLSVINGQTTSNRKRSNNDENGLISSKSKSKRKLESNFEMENSKRFHNEQTLPVFPATNNSILFDENSTKNCSFFDENQRDSNKFQPAIGFADDENLFCEDLDHLLDIFHNELEQISFDPTTIDFTQCFSTNEFSTF